MITDIETSGKRADVSPDCKKKLFLRTFCEAIRSNVAWLSDSNQGSTNKNLTLPRSVSKINLAFSFYLLNLFRIKD